MFLTLLTQRLLNVSGHIVTNKGLILKNYVQNVAAVRRIHSLQATCFHFSAPIPLLRLSSCQTIHISTSQFYFRPPLKNLKHFTQKAFRSVTTHAYCNTIKKLTHTDNAFPLQGTKENCNETIGDRIQREAYTVRNVVEGSILFHWTCSDQQHGIKSVVLSGSAHWTRKHFIWISGHHPQEYPCL
jgi:hypothetical protein